MAGTELLTKARAGDGEAFRQLTAPHHRELQVHCYRMLGSLQDAEDALQDTLLDAWRGLAGFEGRSSIRTWLYRVATNRCLNALRTANRRPAKAWGNPEVEPPEPTRLGEVMWLEPYPDALLDGALAVPGPEARYEQTEAISLAFTTAVQLLPARQRAVLILRDVLGYRADEVAGMLDSTTESVYSALKRARAGLERGLPAGGPQEPPPAPDSPTERALVDGFVRAYASGDVEALVSLLAEDVRVSMPPVPLEYEGRDAATRFFTTVMNRSWSLALVPTRANGQPAFASYLDPAPGRPRLGTGLTVLTLAGDRIDALVKFDSGVLPAFGLPRALPAR
jgi:RNA polymerase sigma-70 factor (ECF subfamily)